MPCLHAGLCVVCSFMHPPAQAIYLYRRIHSSIHPYVTRTDDVLTRTKASPINGFGVFTVTVSMQLNADPRWHVPLLLDARAASIVAGILTSAGAETEEDERYDEEEKEGEEGDEREEEDEREEDEEEGEAVPPPVQLQPPE